MKTTLRDLLIVMMLSVASLVFATAQSLAQKPEIHMQSTSGMVYSGSTLPSAAVQGTFVTGTTIGTYSPTSGSGPNRAKRGADPEDEDTPPPDPHGPNEDPLGDATWLLILAAAVYGVYRRKRV